MCVVNVHLAADGAVAAQVSQMLSGPQAVEIEGINRWPACFIASRAKH